MTAFLILLLVIIVGGAGFAVGLARGRRGSAQKTSSAHDPSAGQDQAASYQAGFLAGHLAGWRDAEAKGHHNDHAAARNAVPAPVSPPPAQTYIQSPVQAPAPPMTPLPTPVSPAPPRAQAFQQPAVQQPPAFRVTQPPAVRETPEAAAARKEKRDQQNINVTLYVASLLLVAAGALFVGTSLPALFRFVGIWFITALFYVSGMVIHARVPRLRPAAVAFVGTGLALVPVTGLAMYNFVLHNGPAAWLVTSLLGTAVYAYTAVKLDNKVLAFLSLSFVVSTAWSGVSVLGGALVWYFTALIGVAVLLTVVSLLSPKWLPPLYVRPLMVLHPALVPLVAVAVTVTPHLLSKGEYAWVMLMCGIYFAVMFFVPHAKYRVQHLYAARAALTLALLGVVWDVTSNVSTVLLAAVICLGVQALSVAFGGRKLLPRSWWADAVSCVALQLLTAAVLTAVLEFKPFDLPNYVPLAVTMLTAMVIGWKLGKGMEFAPAAVLVVGGALGGLLGAWPVAAFLAAATLYWFLRALIGSNEYRQFLILAGRIALTLTVPVAVAGALTGNPDRTPYSVLALVAATAAQQLVSAGCARTGVRLVAPQASVAGFGGAAVAGLLVLPLFDQASGRPVVGAAVLLVLLAGLASGLLLFAPTRPESGVRVTWRATVAEAIAPLTAVIAGGVAAAFVSWTLGNGVLLALLVYLVVTALRISPSFHRHSYWWLSRAAGTLLAVSAYGDMLNHGWNIRFFGEVPATGFVLVMVSAFQLVLPLLAGSRERYPRASVADAGVVVSVMAAATTALTVSSVFWAGNTWDSWQPGAAAAATALAAVLVSAILRRHSIGWIFAPAAFVLLLALRWGNIRDIEVLLGIFAAYSGFMMGVVRHPLTRGCYLLAIRVLTGAFIAVIVTDVTDSSAALSISLALVLALQHAVTMFLGRHGVGVAFLQATVFATLGAQLLLPLAYLLAGDYDGGGRWVVMLELALVVASAGVAWRILGARGAQYFGTTALAAGVIFAGPALVFPTSTWLYQPLLDTSQVPVVLLALSVAMVAARPVFRPENAVRGSVAGVAERLFWLVSALVFALVGGLLALGISHSLTGLSLLVLAGVLFAASHFERIPSLYVAAAPALLIGAVPAVDGLLQGLPAGVWSDYAAWLIGGAGTAALLYSLRMFGGPAIKANDWRRNSLAATAAVATATVAAVGLGRDQTAMLGFVLVVLTGVLVVVEIPRGKWMAGELAGIVSVAALQRATLFVDPSIPDVFWVAQWYVVAGAVIAGLRYGTGQRPEGFLRLCITAGVLSFTSVGTIFGGTAAQQLYVLVAHVLLLAAGLLLAERVLVWWGAIAVALSIMWALRSYAFAMLALVALGLIVLAVWRLNRKPPGNGGDGSDPGGGSGSVPAARSQNGIR
ncbi:hypothetical protein [Paenarthrobacter aurescens]|uniref:Uncharacterized protein n=1 Tax=Paenarthrobacter aurescens TaxID=43663 RepID=A0A4Y3NGT8_PAEAU|nr:hypothetical protein [Paenarthrobacter aurescens]MDO6144357.1 hypothetical protein [Paenarthrobacter aurescens]MDO6148204.1 hypothetical protein [Paenarthrobacter aurescens]MDO6159448.1 hypothetical protein [Paenarthrobacter aurescens]MDO6163431.1 hypothetical protein [Paenarthrobacter aurescens]GEB17919.1 hypothetical protein AAU01_06740 [Paenarthrobacter aurescens]